MADLVSTSTTSLAGGRPGSRNPPTILSLALVLLLPAVGRAQVVEYYSLDAVGSVRVVTDQSGAVIERHDFLPFGEECVTGLCAVNASMALGQPFRFVGKERDAETGLDYFGARYYRANVGRFTTIDPVYTWQENLEDPQRWNRYAYARNNPLKYTDPNGKWIVPAAIALWGAVEFGLQLYDGYSTVQTFSDPNATPRDKAVSGGGFVLGAVAPGGGYGAAGKAALGVANKVDDVQDVGRAGLPFTRKGKREVIAENAQMHGGQTTCLGCSVPTTPATQSKRGVPTPKHETRVDHKVPKSKGGAGSPPNGQVLCSDCNLKKGDKLPSDR